MEIKLPFFLPKLFSPKLLLRISMGGVLFGLLAGYSPSTSNFPPIKQSIVKASPQEARINADLTPIEFKMPHLGYVSTYFSNYHPGIDIATGYGMPVKAAAAGKITNQGYNFFGLGLTVEITHPYGYKTLYAHLGKTYVKKGQTVDSESLIGEVGLTGHTTGPHTHFEMTKDGKTIDPLTLLPKLPTLASSLH